MPLSFSQCSCLSCADCLKLFHFEEKKNKNLSEAYQRQSLKKKKHNENRIQELKHFELSPLKYIKLRTEKMDHLSSANQSGNAKTPGIELRFFGYGVHISPRRNLAGTESENTSSSSNIAVFVLASISSQ